METPHGAGDSGIPAGSIDAVAGAARELLAGLANQIDEVAAWLAPGTPAGSAAEGLLSELSGELSGLFAEVGELLARLIATLIAILEAIASALKAPADAEGSPNTAYQEIVVSIGGNPS